MMLIIAIVQFAGAPISAMGRGQASFEVVPIEEIPFMKDLQEMYLPLFWFEDGVDLEKKFTNMLKYQLILYVFFDLTSTEKIMIDIFFVYF